MSALATPVDWFPIQVGLMMHESKAISRSHPHSRLVRRSIAQQRRDYAQSLAFFSHRSDLNDELHIEHLEPRRPGRKNATMASFGGEGELNSFQGVITWYTGVDLLDRK